MSRFRLSLLVLFALLLAACGGGDEGGGIAYTGISTQTTITDSNATVLSASAYQGGTAGTALSGLGTVQEAQAAPNGQSRILMTVQALEKVVHRINTRSAARNSVLGASVSVSNSIDGDCGGSLSFTLNADQDTGSFSGTFTFNQYCSGGVTQSGSVGVTGQIDFEAERFLTFSLTFNNLSFTSGGDSFAVAGNIALDFSASPNVSVAMTLLLRDTTGKVFWARGYEITLDDQDTFVEVTIAGRFYHPDYGYVEIATETPLHFNKTDGIADDNPSSGVLLFTGKDNAKALQTADDSSTFHVEADKDGDDVYEFNSGPLLWDDI